MAATGVRLTWVASAHYRRLATVALLPLLAAALLGRPGYLVLAAPLVAALALAARRPTYGARITAAWSVDRCIEGDEIVLRILVQPGGPVAGVQVTLRLPEALHMEEGPLATAGDGGTAAHCRVRAGRWGRWDGKAVVTARSRGGLYEATVTVSLDRLSVYPRLPSLNQLALPAQLRTRIGDHVDRRPGEGTDFAGVRPYLPGDQLRRVNWQVTSRRGALHVNQYAAQQAAEIVAIIDAFTDAGPAGESALDRAVRGAAGIARAYSRAGDRVGVITMYGPLRWLAPGTGHRQFFRIAEAVLDARTALSYLQPDVSRVPRAALPPGALLVMFSPLLDERAIAAALDLRARGYPLIIVDVLTSEPRPDKTALAGLALRLWRLEREALRWRLESAGIPVTVWRAGPGETGVSGDSSLDPVLGGFARRRVRGGRR